MRNRNPEASGFRLSGLLKGGKRPDIAGGMKYAELTFDSRTGQHVNLSTCAIK